MRVDKYLKNSRIIKRRSVAKEACEQGRVAINGKLAKPGDKLKEGDIVGLKFGTSNLKIQVLKISDNVGKSEASELYKTID